MPASLSETLKQHMRLTLQILCAFKLQLGDVKSLNYVTARNKSLSSVNSTHLGKLIG